MPNRTSRSVSTAYFLTLAALVAAAFRPESWRVWGLDAWAHAPPVLLGAMVVAALAAPWALAKAARLGERSPRE
ncbi:hypothetical protein K8I85_12800, partial [bacterium]|nr:hypothetical protein [bacterium]